MGMLSDIATLAKAGYSVAEVRELIKLSSGAEEDQPKQNQTQPESAQNMSGSDGKDPEPQPDTEKAPEASQDPASVESADQSKDLSGKVLELEKALAAAQAANRSQDMSQSKPTDEERVKDLVLSFM